MTKRPLKPLQKVLTPDQRTVEEVTQFLNVSPQDLVKTLIFETDKGCIAALVRGDHEISEKKLKAVSEHENLQLAGERRWKRSPMLPKDLLARSVFPSLSSPTWTFRRWSTSSPEPMKRMPISSTSISDRDFQVSSICGYSEIRSGRSLPSLRRRDKDGQRN